MKRHPTFEQLREHQELSVIYPDSERRFRVSLRSWGGCMWAIRVYPDQRQALDSTNPFVTAHRLMERATIEQWLERLRLLRIGGEESCRQLTTEKSVAKHFYRNSNTRCNSASVL